MGQNCGGYQIILSMARLVEDLATLNCHQLQYSDQMLRSKYLDAIIENSLEMKKTDKNTHIISFIIFFYRHTDILSDYIQPAVL